MGILKGFSRLIVGFDVQDGFLSESLPFENCCIKESYFVVVFRCVFPSLFASYIEFVILEALASKERAKTLTTLLAKH